MEGATMPRWMLTLYGFGAGWSWFPHVPAVVFIRTGNALLTATAFVAMSGAARHLARDRREWLAMTLLAWTAFGNLQLGIGYIDVYPVVQAFVALYVVAGLRTLDGSGGTVWPFTLVAAGPFFYIGLSLLVPSALVLALLVARRDGFGKLIFPATIAVLVAGMCTVPVYGYPFAFGRFIGEMPMGADFGLSPDTTLLPAWYLFTSNHLLEVVSGLLLIDGMGVVLTLLFGAWLVRLPSAWFLLAVLAPMLVHFATMDPLFGPYADWDLFSYIAVVTSLVGGFGFVLWARGHARVAGVLLGVVLAANVTHLVAKLNGLELDFEKHIRESPWHSNGALFVPKGIAGRDPARTAELARRQKRRDAAAMAAGQPAP